MRRPGARKPVVGWKKARAWSPIEFGQILVRQSRPNRWPSLKIA